MREGSGRDSSHKRHKERAENKRKNPPRLGGATFQSRPNVWRAGGRREGNTRMLLHGLGWLECGRDVYIENQENRFADRNAWGADGRRQLGQPGTTFSRKPDGQLRTAKDGGRECGRNARRKERQTGQRWTNCWRDAGSEKLHGSFGNGCVGIEGRTAACAEFKQWDEETAGQREPGRIIGCGWGLWEGGLAGTGSISNNPVPLGRQKRRLWFWLGTA